MKKLILISALLFSFNGWAEEIYLECESNGSRLMHNTEWINNSCEITEKIKNYYKILDSSWYGIYREETYNYDDDDISSYKDGQYCGTTVEPFDVLISKAKRTGKAVGWRENISRKNILWETSSEYMEKFAQEAVTLSDDKIWNEFKELGNTAYAPCKVYYAQLKNNKQQNIDICQDICSQLEQFCANADWKSVDHKEINKICSIASTQWNNAKHTNYKQVTKLQKRFDAACAAIDAEQEQYYAANTQAKEKIIVQAKTIAADNPANAIAQIKQLQQRWRLISPARRTQEQQLWQEFNQAIDPVFKGQQEQNALQRGQEQELQQQIKAIYKQLQEHISAANNNTQAGFNKLYAQGKELVDSMSAKSAAYWDKKFNQVSTKFTSSLQTNSTQLQVQDWKNFNAILVKLVECEEMLLTEHTDQLQPELDKLANIQLDDAQLLELIHVRITQFKDLLLAPNKATEITDKQLEQAHLLCVRIEILLSIESPAADKQLRMQYQIENMASNMQAKSKTSNTKQELTDLILALIGLQLLGNVQTLALNARCNNLIAQIIK